MKFHPILTALLLAVATVLPVQPTFGQQKSTMQTKTDDPKIYGNFCKS